MIRAYPPDLIQTARISGQKSGFNMHTGVYVGLKGPSLETGAEMRFLRTIGADAVGFSTVVETISAAHAGMQVLGLSTITNMCLPDALSDTTATTVTTETSVAAIIATAEAAAPRLAALISGILNGRSSP
jgi:purine-nucleoside phosphorylase